MHTFFHYNLKAFDQELAQRLGLIAQPQNEVPFKLIRKTVDAAAAQGKF